MDGSEFRRRIASVRKNAAADEIVLLTSAIWFLVQFLRYLFPPLFNTFQSTYGVSNTETGVLFTALLVGYSVIQFPAGALSDRIGGARMITFGATGFTVASLAVAGASTFLTLSGAAVLIGLATGIHKTVAVPYLSSARPERKGYILGVMDTIGQFGGIVAPLFVAAVLASTFPWNVTFLLGALVSGTITGLFYIRVTADAVPLRADRSQESKKESTNGTSERANVTYLSVFLNVRFLLFVAVVTVFTFAWNGFTSFFPLFLIDEKGLGSQTVSLLYSFLFVASLSQTATGWISDRFDRISILLTLLLLIVCSLLAIILVGGVWVLAILTVFIGIGFHGFRPVRDSYFMDLIPNSVGSGTFGIVRTLMTAGGAIGPAVVGYVSDVAGYIYAFSLLGALLGTAVLLLVVLRIS